MTEQSPGCQGREEPGLAAARRQLQLQVTERVLQHPLPRVSSVANIILYQIVDGDIVFALDGLEENSRPGHLRKEIGCPGGTAASLLSLVSCLIEYSARTTHKWS